MSTRVINQRLIILTDREERALEEAKATGFWPEPLRRKTLTDAEAREMAASEMYGLIGERVRPEAGGVTNEPGAIIRVSDYNNRPAFILDAVGQRVLAANRAAALDALDREFHPPMKPWLNMYKAVDAIGLILILAAVAAWLLR